MFYFQHDKMQEQFRQALPNRQNELFLGVWFFHRRKGFVIYNDFSLLWSKIPLH
jgi:hypothetical protein